MKFSKERMQALLGSAARIAECRDRRAAWAKETAAAMREAHRAMDERLGEAAHRLSEEEFERLCEEEEAKIDVFRAPMMDAAHHDRWPRHLHVGGL